MKKIYTIFALSAASVAFSQIQKVEPAFWWKGMKNPELQILVYGKNIANNEIELSDHIQIKDIQKVENPNYVFITVNTNEINVPAFKINLKKGKKNINSYSYELKQRLPGSADRESFTSKDVMYLIMPDRFANGDEKNDSRPDLTEKRIETCPTEGMAVIFAELSIILIIFRILVPHLYGLLLLMKTMKKYTPITDMHRPIFIKSTDDLVPMKNTVSFRRS